MNGSVAVRPRIEEDPVSNVLKWILLAVAVGSFALFAWATVLTYERAAAATRPLRHGRRRDADDRRRHRRRQGRLSESRPDGLRQPLRHGLLFRPGLHGLRAGAPRRADRGKPRPGPLRRGVRRPVARAAGRGPRRHAAAASAGRSDPAGSHVPDALAGAIATLRDEHRQEPCDDRSRRPAGPRPTA